MKKIPDMYKLFLPCLILFASIFMGIGYASYSTYDLNVNGSAIASGKVGIFISESKINGKYLASDDSYTKIVGDDILEGYIVLSDNDLSSYVSGEVVILNTTPDIQTYRGIITDYSDSNFYSNLNIDYNITGLNIGDTINPGESVTVGITYKYSDAYKNTNPTNLTNTLMSLLKFDFSTELITYTVSYTGVSPVSGTNNINSGNNLVVNYGFNEISFNITMNDVAVSNYTFNNGILTVPNVVGNVIIEAIDDRVDFYFDGSSNSISSSKFNTTTPPTIDEVLAMELKGLNDSSRTITSVVVNLNYTKSGGGNQTVNCYLKYGTVSVYKTLSFNAASGTATVTFNNADGISIPAGTNFTITYQPLKLSNKSINISENSVTIGYN